MKIERDAQELADSLGVKIFQADIIYHLFDKFTNYREELKQRKRDENKHIAVFPCKLKILPQVRVYARVMRAFACASKGLKRTLPRAINKRDLRRRDVVVGDLRTRGLFFFKRGPVWISVRIQLEGSDRDRRDGRGWNRQGRNAALRPEQGRELTLHSFFLSTPETLSRITMYTYMPLLEYV